MLGKSKINGLAPCDHMMIPVSPTLKKNRMAKLRTLVLLVAIIPAMLLGLSGCSLLGMAARAAGAAASMAVRLAPVKLMFMCIPENTLVDTPNGTRPIETVRPGDEVIGFAGDPVRVLQVHAYVEDPASKRFLRIEFGNNAVVQLCDMHRIDGIQGKELQPGDSIAGQTVKSVTPFDGVERSYDLLTEDVGYRISGLPVNSMIEEMIEASLTQPQP
jgi:hypothetical protein